MSISDYNEKGKIIKGNFISIKEYEATKKTLGILVAYDLAYKLDFLWEQESLVDDPNIISF